MTTACLILNGLQLDIYLGWPKTERLERQVVSVDITIEFDRPPEACVTDRLKDTFCYDELVCLLKEKIAARSFKLIEHFTHEIYQAAKEFLPENARLRLCVTKKPAIENLSGGVRFCYGDEL